MLITLQPLGEGYIAILLTKLEDADTACDKLLTEDDYKDYLAKKTFKTEAKIWTCVMWNCNYA